MSRYVLGAMLVSLLLTSGASAKNYQKVVCESEPDPVRCKQIEQWYVNAVNNSGGGCCGLGDAYWADKIDKVTSKGIFLTVTDSRDCKSSQNPRYDEDEEGNFYELHDDSLGDCIPGRINMDGRHLYVPNYIIDHFMVDCPEGKCYQGNPTGHTVIYLQAKGLSRYDGGGEEAKWPTVLCFFPRFDN